MLPNLQEVGCEVRGVRGGWFELLETEQNYLKYMKSDTTWDSVSRLCMSWDSLKGIITFSASRLKIKTGFLPGLS